MRKRSELSRLAPGGSRLPPAPQEPETRRFSAFTACLLHRKEHRPAVERV